mmetsp:Transcript_9423/g.20386  ORF Transcript_9423/g.20386 Transcript_9423/m.20386 type:complete len:311 (+) Transcript_9423:435-1367(+)
MRHSTPYCAPKYIMEVIRNIFSRTSTMQLPQDRLLILLHHARKCPHGEESGTICPVTPHCAVMKNLWKHIAHCKHKRCPQCYSARHLLTHYRNCKDGNCPICGPVREVIRRGREDKIACCSTPSSMGSNSCIPAIMKTDTFSTGMTTGASASANDAGGTSAMTGTQQQPPPPSKSTIDEWVACRRAEAAGATVTPAGTPSPSPVRQNSMSGRLGNVGRIIPVHRRSFSSMSSISYSSGSVAPSSRSSAPSSRSGGSGNFGVYCPECRMVGLVRRRCNSGIRCRNNLGIAHFCKDVKEDGSAASQRSASQK